MRLTLEENPDDEKAARCLHAAAQQDRLGVAAWIERTASKQVARRFDKRIADSITRLQYGSERGSIREPERGVRLIGILPTISIAFTVTEDAVIIHRVLHNGQNWQPDD